MFTGIHVGLEIKHSERKTSKKYDDRLNLRRTKQYKRYSLTRPIQPLLRVLKSAIWRLSEVQKFPYFVQLSVLRVREENVTKFKRLTDRNKRPVWTC